MEEFHPDRGDTQRSVFIFQNLSVIFIQMIRENVKFKK